MIVLQVKKAYRWVQAMSLDVVLGSGLLNLAIAKYYKVNLPLPVVVALMIAVWAIYTFDHLSDAKKINKVASTHRHRYHQQHYKLLKLLLLLAIFAGIAVTFLLPPVVVKWGIICTVCVVAYFLLLKLKFFWYKELFIAVCYTIGVFLGPLCLSLEALNLFQLLLIPQILLLALSNLVIFSCFDYQTDKQDGHYSLALHLGLSRARKIAKGLVIIGLVLTAIMFFLAKLFITQEVQLFIFTMNLLLLILLLKEKSFQQNNLYRMVGDGIFFIPILFLLYAR
jgi:4-hydroxybenzoate polyprenyltransferase